MSTKHTQSQQSAKTAGLNIESQNHSDEAIAHVLKASDLNLKTAAEKSLSIHKELTETISCRTCDLRSAKSGLIEEMRSMRVSVAIEAQQIIKPLEDIRKFFLNSDHEKEVQRLKEFIELCERLERLKKSGFLDTIADTILKLS